MYNLKGLRKEVNKTQSEIAVLFGCKQNNISMQEKSDRDLTTEQMDVLRKNFGEEIVNKYYYKISTSNVETINNERESTLTYIIHSGFISGYQNRYGDNLKPPTNVYHRMTA